jgi:hypothetical protein
MKKVLVAVVAAGALVLTGTPALAAPTTLGPHGYGKVRLGMSAKRAAATGAVVLKRRAGDGACAGWDLKAHPTGRDSVGLYISKKLGVAAIFAAKGVKTPKGIGIGSTMRQVKKAYPAMRTSESGISSVVVPGNPKARYLFGASAKGKLVELALTRVGQDCMG